MGQEKKKEPQVSRAGELARVRKEILALSPEKALDRILDDPQPAALVRSFPEEDFYFLVHDIGPEDALPLLSLASERQWEHLLDLEAWSKDRLDLPSHGRWLDLLLRADTARLVRWLATEKRELLEFVLFNSIEIRVREHDQDPSDFGDGFFTLDDTFYIRIRPDWAKAGDGEKGPESSREELLTKVLNRIAELDYRVFTDLLLESDSLLPAEAEEEAYRLRSVRLAEKGFLPFEDAVGVYRHLSAAELFSGGRKALSRDPAVSEPLPVPVFAEGLLEDSGLFSRALRALPQTEGLLSLQAELAGLCNRIISADNRPVRDRESLRGVVAKGAGYLSIGLEHLARDRSGPLVSEAARLIEELPLLGIFRVGYGLAMELKWRAQRWRRESWFESAAGLSLGFWDERWLGVLGGLLLPRPMAFDNLRKGVLYRDFLTLEEIHQAERDLAAIMALDGILARLGIDPAGRPSRFLTYKALLLTLWARHHLGLCAGHAKESLDASLSLESLRRVHETLFQGPPAEDRRIDDRIKADFLSWMAGRSGMDAERLSERVGPQLEALFAEIEAELGAVAACDLDPRFIRLFVVTPGEEGE